MAAIEAIESGTYSEIWVWKFSRFGRSRHGVAINLARIEAVGGELVSATEPVDARTATGRFTRGMLLEIAAFESDRAGEQWRETHDLRRAAGVPATGGRRFGYLWHPRRLPDGKGGWTVQEERYEVFPDEAEAALDGFTRYRHGKVGFGKVARAFNELGLLNTRGAPWQDQTVKWYFDSGFMAGLLRVHNRDAKCGDPSRCQNREHYDYRPAEHEAIVTGEEWDEYRERRESQATPGRRTIDPVYPLAGLVRCGLCGGAGSVHQSKGIPGHAYRCGARARNLVTHEPVWIRRQLVEDAVYGWLLKVRDEIDERAAGATAMPKAPPAAVRDTKVTKTRLSSEIATLVAALDRATDGHARGVIPEDAYIRTRDRLQAELRENRARLAALKAEDEETGPQLYSEVVEGLIEEWDTIGVQGLRITLRRIVRKVEIWPGHHATVDPIWLPAKS